jgi:hypothetical protein
MAAVLLGLLLTVAYASRPPRPDLPLPKGFRVVAVEGHCAEGSELFMCAAGDGPRSTLTIAVTGDAATSYDRVRDYALEHGWTPVNGRLCHTGQGCVERQQVTAAGRLVVAWWQTEHTQCAAPGDVVLDPVDCSTPR